MKKKKYLTDDQEIDRIIDKNRELIEALKNLNEKLCCENSLPDNDSVDKHTFAEQDKSNVVKNY